MIKTRPLVPEAFAPFGQVLRSGAGDTKMIRDGQVLMTKTLAEVDHEPEGSDFAIDFHDVPALSGPLVIREAERHLQSAQVFVPVNASRYLVVVWPGDPGPGVEPIAFIAGAQDVIVYNPGTWHHGIVALDRRAVFTSLFWRPNDGRPDTIFQTLQEPIKVDWMSMPADLSGREESAFGGW